MVKRMLIDATHSEETRVAVVTGNRLDEFDFETSIKKQLKGNIYLAKVIRVEPSLQAAFVDYGGNRHGFLAFSEIHPDYYRIPIADREALLAAEAATAGDDMEADSNDLPDVPDVPDVPDEINGDHESSDAELTDSDPVDGEVPEGGAAAEAADGTGDGSSDEGADGAPTPWRRKPSPPTTTRTDAGDAAAAVSRSWAGTGPTKWRPGID